jgi:hypothetical protein
VPQILGRIYQKAGDELYFVFRVLVGFLFALHGSQKLFGAFTDMGAVELGSLFWFAGVIELFGGAAIALGIFARLVASITTIQDVIQQGLKFYLIKCWSNQARVSIQAWLAAWGLYRSPVPLKKAWSAPG